MGIFSESRVTELGVWHLYRLHFAWSGEQEVQAGSGAQAACQGPQALTTPPPVRSVQQSHTLSVCASGLDSELASKSDSLKGKGHSMKRLIQAYQEKQLNNPAGFANCNVRKPQQNTEDPLVGEEQP